MNTYIHTHVYMVIYLHEVSLREIDAKVLPSQKPSREPSEKCHNEDVLDKTVPESGRIELAAVTGGGRLVWCRRDKTYTDVVQQQQQHHKMIVCDFLANDNNRLFPCLFACNELSNCMIEMLFWCW